MATSEHDLATSIIRFWGKHAARMARQYALKYEKLGRPGEAAKWYGAERIIDRLQNTPSGFGLTQ
jgi:hypothetical protein